MEQYVKDELVKELRNVSRKMREEADPSKKVFFYSAAYGIVDRSMRYSFGKELLITNTILNSSHITRM